jgi:hypothetical protein
MKLKLYGNHFIPHPSFFRSGYGVAVALRFARTAFEVVFLLRVLSNLIVGSYASLRPLAAVLKLERSVESR